MTKKDSNKSLKESRFDFQQDTEQATSSDSKAEPSGAVVDDETDYHYYYYGNNNSDDMKNKCGASGSVDRTGDCYYVEKKMKNSIYCGDDLESDCDDNIEFEKLSVSSFSIAMDALEAEEIGCFGGVRGDKDGNETVAASLVLNIGSKPRLMARSVLAILIVVGAIVSSLFLYLGIWSAQKDKLLQFEESASELVKEIKTAFHEYEVAGQWVQESCRQRQITRETFKALYLNLQSTGLQFQVMSFNPNVTSSTERLALEAESRQFYTREYPNINYTGIQGLEPQINDNGGGMAVVPRSQQPFYFPVHYLEPVEGNEAAIDFDLYSSASRRVTIHRAIDNWEPALTPRLRLVQETDPSAFSVILMHPGIPLPQELQSKHPPTVSNTTQQRPDSFSSMVIRIPDLLWMASQLGEPIEGMSVYIYDAFHPDEQFLGGARFHASTGKENPKDHPTGVGHKNPWLEYLNEVVHHSSLKAPLIRTDTINIISDQSWTIVVTSDSYNIDFKFIILAGVLMFVLCTTLGFYFYANVNRMTYLSRVKAQAQKERAQLVVENAKESARNERELNDFIAHEVRNPLAAAMSACSFVSAAVSEQKQQVPPKPWDSAQRKAVEEDIGIIESSLHFINDLLRNMLDMQRAKANQMKIECSPTHIMNDVFKPVDCMLHRRGATFDVELEVINKAIGASNTNQNLVVMADSLRLKQIMLNLARNAVKFVDHGFIRLKAEVNDNGDNVQLSVEDSGPGIPLEKRQQLFGRFQESLDSLNQGTGIGLNLCKSLSELMGGRLYIDENYDSGVPGCPGTRFVLDLNTPPMEWDDKLLDSLEKQQHHQRYHRHSNASASSAELKPLFSIPTTTPNLSQEQTEQINSPQLPVSTPTTSNQQQQVQPDQHQNNDITTEKLPTITSRQEEEENQQLPENLSVLFVDDDMVLRKLFVRSVKKLCPTWSVQEAGNGETALQIAAPENNARTEEKFDLIFMDQYMASVQKQLLGTEATRALRAQGVTKARICGFSANDVEQSFYDAGADSFLFKPFPCKPDLLKTELLRVVSTRRYNIVQPETNET